MCLVLMDACALNRGPRHTRMARPARSLAHVVSLMACKNCSPASRILKVLERDKTSVSYKIASPQWSQKAQVA